MKTKKYVTDVYISPFDALHMYIFMFVLQY